MELDGSNPGRACISEPFNTYEAAKTSKQKLKARDMEQTSIFRAETKSDAELAMQKELFSRL
ncbi:hypothetical protein AN394_04186 [Pseudoalteromonas sp. P1-26]|uniref:hypothetical protein n=1 Tax=Pseudoalteromonas sp. P1-26 TaxID=1723759 RepID=UPI0006E59B1B|nr:hypothetical protein [Pseudoalteromonas sp. P1-26]KPZ66000.1 hypothetical protein AN394_04186 [Pseudoalteromonas sp. P1-26]